MEINETKKIKNIIHKITPNSIAEELGIEKGDILVSVNGQEIEDIIEYKYLISEEYLEIEIKKKNGNDIYIYEIEKEYDDDLGLEFRNPIIDKAKSCSNKCIFCFIDQLPKGMRKSLYFKDDDSRLSFLQGNFITLTNMSEKDIDKIIKYKISPINISIHTTNPELRVKMLNNKKAGEAYKIMERFSSAGIEMNCQIVLCPTINDGIELEKTLIDLSKLYPFVNSVAVVPIGITKYRNDLDEIEIYNKERSINLLRDIIIKQKEFLDTLNTRFIFPSDEFFVMADMEIPSEEEYEGFSQLENGVGLMRKFEDDIIKNIKKYPISFRTKKIISIATGKSAYEYMCKISDLICSKIKNLEIKVYKIENDFFGRTISVAGLITAIDLKNQLSNYNLGDALLIPRAMLKADEEIFLDNISLIELEEDLNIKIIPCENNGNKFIKNIIQVKKKGNEICKDQ